MMSVYFGTFALAIAVIIFAPCLVMPPSSALAADHEAGDVGDEQQRDVSLAAQIDEVGCLKRAFGEQHAVVAENADLETHDARKAGDQRIAVKRLEFVKLAAVDQAREDFAIIGRNSWVRADDAVDLGRIEARRAQRRDTPALRRNIAEIGDDIARDRDRVAVVSAR